MDDLLKQKDVVNDAPSRDKGTLNRANSLRKIRLQSLYNNFWDQLSARVVEGNLPQLVAMCQL